MCSLVHNIACSTYIIVPYIACPIYTLHLFPLRYSLLVPQVGEYILYYCELCLVSSIFIVGLTYGDKMDINGVPISGTTLLANLGLPLDQIYQVIVPENIENQYLYDALVRLDFLPDGLETPETKNFKLYFYTDW